MQIPCRFVICCLVTQGVIAAICILAVWLYVCDKKQKAEKRAQWNKEFEQQKADWMSGISEPEGYGLVSELAEDAIFHTYRLKNGRIRQFCDYVPTSPDAIEFHYLGVIEGGESDYWSSSFGEKYVDVAFSTTIEGKWCG